MSILSDLAPGIRASLLELLIARGPMTASEIHAAVSGGVKRCTLQAVYKELSHLRSRNVVLKIGSRYGIALPWVLNYLSLGDDLSRACLDGTLGFFRLPAPGERVRWTFTEVRRGDAIWMQLMLRILQEFEPKEMFQWLPHPWHHLLYGARSSRLDEALRMLGARDYVIVGGDTFLDRRAAGSWSRESFVHAFAPGPFAADRTDYVTAAGDFVLTTSYQAKLVNEIDRLYSRISSVKDIRAEEVLAIFDSRTKITVTLENSPAKARRTVRRFRDYFGIKALP